jgi:hypothetical protein
MQLEEEKITASLQVLRNQKRRHTEFSHVSILPSISIKDSNVSNNEMDDIER